MPHRHTWQTSLTGLLHETLAAPNASDMNPAQFENPPTIGAPGRCRNLYQYLNLPNPQIQTSARYSSKKGSNTDSRWRAEPEHIRRWENFPFDRTQPSIAATIQEMLNVDQNPWHLSDYTSIDSFPSCRIFDEDSLEALLIRWTHAVVARALALAQPWPSSKWPYRQIFMARGGQAILASLSSGSEPAKKAGTYPDWAGIQRHDRDRIDTGQYLNVLPGDSKLSQKWKSSMIEHSRKKGDRAPIKQVYNYCIAGRCRYGYIITDEELVPIRVDATTKTLEWTSIPWIQTRRDAMTINLALWYLHLIAASESGSLLRPDDARGSREASAALSYITGASQHDRTPTPQRVSPGPSSSGSRGPLRGR